MHGGSEEAIDFHLIAEHTCDWESWLDPEGKAIWVNAVVEDITGRAPAECLAMADYPLALADSRDRPILEQILSEARVGGRGNDQPLRIRRVDGSQAWVAISWKGVRHPEGGLAGIRLSIRDQSTSRIGPFLNRYHHALSRLARSGVLSSGSLQDAFEAITETAARVLDVARVGIWLLDDARSRIDCRDMFDLAGGVHSAGQIVEKARYPDYFRALEEDRVVDAHQARHDPRTRELTDDYLAPLGIGAMLDTPIVRGGRTVGVLCHEQMGPARHWIPGEVSFASSLADMVAMALEASERREIEARQGRLASILEATPDFVGTTGTDGRPTYINPAGRRLVGLAQDESLEDWEVGQLYPLWAKEQRDRVAIPTAIREGVWTGESAFQDRHGVPFPVSQVLIAHKDEHGHLKFLSTVARDLRPWKAAQAALQERERFLATLVANLPGVAYRRRNEPGWPMEYISKGCLELTGYPAESLMAGQPCFNDIVHPEDRERVYAEVDLALAEYRSFKVEYRIVRADGREIWVWSKGRGIYNEAGWLVAREGFIGDITERVQAQLALERLNTELEGRVAERTARLAEANQHLEAFAYSVSHDLKAPLRGIDGYSRLLLEDYRDALPEEGQRFLDNIRAASGRMNQLIDDLLAYSRLERRELSSIRVGLDNIVARVLAEREIELSERALVLDNQVGDLVVVADADALTQAVRNLLDNALKFSRDASPARIAITAEPRDGRVILKVADNGCGFDMKYHDRIFDIFQRLHRAEEFPGTGVGLAIVRKAMERMGGKVWAESTPGVGTSFFLELPT